MARYGEQLPLPIDWFADAYDDESNDENDD